MMIATPIPIDYTKTLGEQKDGSKDLDEDVDHVKKMIPGGLPEF